MPDQEGAVATQLDATQNTDVNEGETPQAEGVGDEQFFLSVDDRTRYKTQEEAVEGFKKAGQRISELTPFYEKLSEYKISTPEELQYYLDRLLEFEEKETAASSSPAAKPAAQPEPPAATAQRSKEDQEAIAYINKIKPDLGFVTQNEIDEMKRTIESLRSERDASEQQQTQRAVEAGQAELHSLLEARGIISKSTDAAQAARIQQKVADFIEARILKGSYDKNDKVIPGSPLARFLQGGAAQKKTIEDGFAEWEETASFYAAQKTKSSDATYQGNKQNAMQKTAKPLTKPNAAGAAPKLAKPSREDEDEEINERAWQVFQGAQQQ